jgi:hypothetical protein
LSPAASSYELTGIVGAPVSILLESTPGSGAIWYAPEAPPHTTLESLDAIPEGGGIGGAVTQVFEFRADAPGTYELGFRLKREWETAVREQREVVIQISAGS